MYDQNIFEFLYPISNLRQISWLVLPQQSGVGTFDSEFSVFNRIYHKSFHDYLYARISLCIRLNPSTVGGQIYGPWDGTDFKNLEEVLLILANGVAAS